MSSAIAVVGLACRYPDAADPAALWENVLAQRRAFRRMPPERLRLEDYYSPDRSIPDRTYSTQAAVIEGYEFDRLAFRVAGTTFRSADLAHWLALDVAARALADAGWPNAQGVPRQTTGVLLGNTLTGEFSRANVMRLRWPYVRRVLEAQLVEEGWPQDQRARFLARMESQYKSAFPPIGEETLAGGLSNTIAGRICNHFDLKGGGYTVDGACAASLLAVTTACSSLVSGDIDVALAGGVDLSLDPFELVGFAKTGALAPELMRVYDRRSAGFWPGEGCGFAVLMRLEDAIEHGRRIYAVVRGWGISSDGGGGITRPTVEGQLLAVRRAYRRAGYGIDTVEYFEGHGTGTQVGDEHELKVLSDARRESGGRTSAVLPVIGSIKGNIGHTKAAAGMAGFIKAVLAVHQRTLPPITGCFEPHEALAGEDAMLRVLRTVEPWPAGRAVRASVSAMGFGGINTHVTLEGHGKPPAAALGERERMLARSAQDGELLLLGASDASELRRRVEQVHACVGRVSGAELGDLCATLARTLGSRQCRAAVVAATPAEAEARLAALLECLSGGAAQRIDQEGGVYLGAGIVAPRVGFLFPGQAAPTYRDGGAWARRFEDVSRLYESIALPAIDDDRATALAQPAIAAACAAGLRVLERLGLSAEAAAGHSLGELAALCWGGAFDEAALLRTARARGAAMASVRGPAGGMASLGAGPEEAARLIAGLPLVISNYNSPLKTVVSGEAPAIDAAIERARAARVAAIRLPVSHAFHSPLVAASAADLARHLQSEAIGPLERTVFSTITGDRLGASDDLGRLLREQVTAPVRFTDAAARLAGACDVLVEVGPGQMMSRLMADIAAKPVFPLDCGGPSLLGLLHATGAAFALGAPLRVAALFEDRFNRPFDLDWRPRFFASPCEQAPVPEGAAAQAPLPAPSAPAPEPSAASAARAPAPASSPASAREAIRELVAQRAELPAASVKDDDRFLSDLHLNSITVGQILAEAARRAGLSPPVSPTEYADATIAEAAAALELVSAGAAPREPQAVPAGVEPWLRAFTVESLERARPRAHDRATLARGPGAWTIVAATDHPLAARLAAPLTRAVPGGGVVACLPPEAGEENIDLVLDAAQTALRNREDGRFVLVQHGGGAASFARTLHMEAPQVTTIVVDLPVDHVDALDWILAEAASGSGYSEARYDHDGRRFEPLMRPVPLEPDDHPFRLVPRDVLLVSGGGKGIAAECALSLARKSGARLVLLGRSDPHADRELAANLDRLKAHGVTFRYLMADVTDGDSVAAAVRQAQRELGPVTAFLHGAGRNVPQLIGALDTMALRRTLAPKIRGARNVLAALDPKALRLFVTFSSIIARIGLEGEADYALANEWLTALTERWQHEHPACRCLALEWSVWSGVGMGQRLGRADILLSHGVTPLAPDQSIAFLERLLESRVHSTALVVSGRFGDPPTVRLEGRELPLRRFLERPRVIYPGIEIVADSTISSDTDPYLEDHVFHGERLLPAVMGLEAMAQAASVLSGHGLPAVLEDVELSRPIVVSRGGEQTLRIAAVRRESGEVVLALRSGESDFQVDHFRATWRAAAPGAAPVATAANVAAAPAAGNGTVLAIDPARDLYGAILFHEGRFRRIRGYRRLSARECEVEIEAGPDAPWFAQYLPRELLLGDPGARDAAIHCIQACIPHARLLPIGAERIALGVLPPGRPFLVRARERERHGDTFTYDMTIHAESGREIERWTGLRLRAVEAIDAGRPWAEPMLVPYLERKAEELIPGARASMAFEHNGVLGRQERSDLAAAGALGRAVRVHRRPDGRPEVPGDSRQVSVAHAGELTFAMAGSGPIGLDLEAVDARGEAAWRSMLTPDRFALAAVLSRECGEDADTSATRVWAAGECLVKAQVPADAPLTLKSVSGDGWIVLACGDLRIATFAAPVRGARSPLVFGLLAGQGP